MSQPEPSILLKTHNLTIGYKESLLENLDLKLIAGELVCFMGPNGIGKSTLIRTLAGLQSPISGTVDTYKEAEVANENVKKIAVVLTDRIAASAMSVYDIITFGRYPYLDWNLRLSAEDKRIIDESIDLVQVRHLVGKKLHQLSDGQVQLIMIARALAQQTDIVLLDEPTAHLDLNNRIEIMRLLRNLAHQTNRAVLVATHELDLALQTTDRIWLTGKAKNIITGVPEDLVLNGTFDDIFAFKGFDLKSGKVQHESHRTKTIQLTGGGPEYLWTLNALERNGYPIVFQNPVHHIAVVNTNAQLSWTTEEKNFHSISELLAFLDKP